MEQIIWTRTMLDYEQLLKDQLSVIDMAKRNKDNRHLLTQFKSNATTINKVTTEVRRSASEVIKLNKQEELTEEDLESEEIIEDVSNLGKVVGHFNPKTYKK